MTARTRLSPRGQRLIDSAAALLMAVALIAGLVAAGLIGDHHRCQALLADHSPRAAQYCPPTTDPQEPRR